MNPQQPVQHSPAWVGFTYASFAAALFMVVVGNPLRAARHLDQRLLRHGDRDAVQSCITVTKTIRDVHEAGRLVNGIEDAKTERLLMGMERGKE